MSADELAGPARRRFIAGASALIGCSVLAPTMGRAVAATGYQPSALTLAELDTLRAALARLIPADSSGGGAVEAHAHEYIDRALSSAYAAQLPTYRHGLAALASLARIDSTAGASTLPLARLDAILARMESGGVVEPLIDSLKQPIVLSDGGRTFFRMLLRHTLEGTFGDPVHGGNHNYLGWQLIGYSGIQLAYSDAEQSLDGPATAKNRSIASFRGRTL